MKNIYIVIMAGGVGSRFWPFSRQSHPKQFHDILGTGKTLIQQTAERFDEICPKENIYIVTNEAYSTLVKDQLPFLDNDQLLKEPIGRNTAPCIAYACYKIKSINPDACIVVAPSDHLILKEETFKQKILLAIDTAKKSETLVTLGINPTRPDTGYGYIRFKKENSNVLPVIQFTEKPNLATAIKFLESGDYTWNAGIFIWHVNTISAAFEKYLPALAATFGNFDGYFTDGEQEYIDTVYPDCPSVSIDYGIMEHATNVYVVPGDYGWSDLGTWKSLYDTSTTKDNDSNVISGDVITYNTKDCIIRTPMHKLVVINGLEGYIVAEHDNVLMICPLNQEQQVKEYVETVKNTRSENYY